MPNISGDVAFGGGSSDAYGSFYRYISVTGNNGASTEPNVLGRLGFDASKSNSIYGASDKVQPPALTAIFAIKY